MLLRKRRNKNQTDLYYYICPIVRPVPLGTALRWGMCRILSLSDAVSVHFLHISQSKKNTTKLLHLLGRVSTTFFAAFAARGMRSNSRARNGTIFANADDPIPSGSICSRIFKLKIVGRM